MDISPEHMKTITYTSLAGIGGVLGYIYRETRAGRKLLITKIAITGAMAAFIGYHMILVYQSFGLPESIIGALNGLTALLGVELMLYIAEKLIFKKLGLTYEDRVVKALIDAGWTPPSSGNPSLSDIQIPVTSTAKERAGADSK